MELAALDDRRENLEFSIQRVRPSSCWDCFDITTLGNKAEITVQRPNFNFTQQTSYFVDIVAKDDLFTSEVKTLAVEVTWVNMRPEVTCPLIIEATIDELQVQTSRF